MLFYSKFIRFLNLCLSFKKIWREVPCYVSRTCDAFNSLLLCFIISPVHQNLEFMPKFQKKKKNEVEVSIFQELEMYCCLLLLCFTCSYRNLVDSVLVEGAMNNEDLLFENTP